MIPSAVKDIAMLFDGSANAVRDTMAGIALRRSHHDGARLAVFSSAIAPALEALSTRLDPESDSYAAVDIWGMTARPGGRRTPRRSPVGELLQEAEEGGGIVEVRGIEPLLGHLRCMDLVIAAAPAPGDGGPETNIDDIVIGAGRPALIVPQRFAERRPAARKMGYRVFVAWAGSAPCTRAAHDALVFLRRADEVVLATVARTRVDGCTPATADAMARHLERHGTRVRSELLPADHRRPAQTILNRLAELGCDLLAMGAFGRARLAETWFGGTSVDLRRSSGVPILTSH